MIEKLFGKYQGSKKDEKYRYFNKDGKIFDFKNMVLTRQIDGKFYYI